MTIDFNHRAAIAASLQDLSNDLDCPVHIDGDMHDGHEYGDMDPGEAARIVVDTILDHPFVQAEFQESERFWKALKWITTHQGEAPEEIQAVLDTAFEAAFIESHE